MDGHSLVPVARPLDLLSAPIGRYYRGSSIVVWVASPTLLGALHLGPLALADCNALVELFPLPTSQALAPRYDLLHDIGAVATFDQRAFALLEQFLRAWIYQFSHRVNRVAVVRPSGLAGAAITGMFHEWVAPRFDARLCMTAADADRFLGLDDTHPSSCALRDLRERHAPPLAMRRLRAYLDVHLRDATLELAAGELSMSARSLQRYLTEQHTSFRDEHTNARLRRAEATLLDGDHKVETVAKELGFASAEAFTVMFKKRTGQTPTAFREQCQRP